MSICYADFKQVVRDFNQSGYLPHNIKLDPEGARFQNVSLTLHGVTWHETTFEAPDFSASKEVALQSSRPGVVATVTATSDAVPGSTLRIVSGIITGIPEEISKVRMQMPPRFGREQQLYLNTNNQTLHFSQEGPEKKTEKIQDSGKVSVKSRPTVYQGSFKAEARFSGPVMFKTQSGGSFQVGIEVMAKQADAQHCLSKPFFFSSNSLCWNVMGNMDLLVEHIRLTKRN